MTTARKTQISFDDTPYYHCMAHCVRRAFLCGEDLLTGQNFDHRKQWIVNKLKELAEVFSIRVCAYAVMGNHYHVVLYVDEKQAQSWSQHDVIDRWAALFNGHLLVQRFRNDTLASAVEISQATEIINEYRQRLTDVSWFMRCLNEHIARRANAEDHCRGRFWEGRFKSQALLDETALLTCMVYVDLNPVRAGIADDLEHAEYTSIQERIQAYGEKLEQNREPTKTKSKTDSTLRCPQAFFSAQPKGLMPFLGDESLRNQHETGIFFSLTDYLQLADWTGRVVREDKRGAIPGHIRPILERLGVNPQYWADTVKEFGRSFYSSMGSEENLVSLSEKREVNWIRGISTSRRLYLSSPPH